jgi:hypothetical protein
MGALNETLVRLIAYYVWEKSVREGAEMTAFDCWITGVGIYCDIQYFRPVTPG